MALLKEFLQNHRRTLHRIAAVLFSITLVTVLWLALTPAPPTTVDLGWDKANHATAFLVLTLLCDIAWPARWWRNAIGLVAVGGLIEIVQLYVPNRSAEWADLGADTVGIVVGSLLILALRRGLRARRKHPSSLH